MAVTREEELLNSLANGVPSDITPITREEQYLSYIGGGSYSYPLEPITRKEALLKSIAEKGVSGGGGVTIRNQNKTITENGTYTADSGYTGLGTVTVDVASGGGNFSKCTSGTITPLGQINEIEHGLGEIPKMFMWVVTFNHTMTGRLMGASASLFSDEQAYDTADASEYAPYYTRLAFILIDGIVYSYSANALIDWGFFTKGTLANNEHTSVYPISIDESKFVGGSRTNSIIPYSTEGNITVNWFAFGG